MFVLIFPAMAAQGQVKGKITTEDKAAANIKIENLTQHSFTFSDEVGQFTLEAVVNDTLLVNDVFYELQHWVVNRDMLEKGIEIQLQKKEFALEEVVLIAPSKKFDVTQFDKDFKAEIEKDMVEHPYLYQPPGTYGNGGNLLGLVVLAVEGVGSLLGIQKKEREVVRYVSFEDLENIFDEDDFFNNDLLVNTLQIDSDKKFLFFAYCEDRNINADLLKSENHFLLLDKLLTYAKGFKKELAAE